VTIANTSGVLANKGLQVNASKNFGLIECATDDYILKYDLGTQTWACATDQTGTGSGAPTNASYIVVGVNDELIAERALIAGSGLVSVDGGENGNFTLSVGAGTGISVLADSLRVANTSFSCGLTDQSLKSIDIDTGAATCETDDAGVSNEGTACWCDAGQPGVDFVSSGGGAGFRLWSGWDDASIGNKYHLQGDIATLNEYSGDTCRVCAVGGGQLITHAHRVSPASFGPGDGAPLCPAGSTAYNGYWVCKD
jgi:hypothetical protein